MSCSCRSRSPFRREAKTEIEENEFHLNLPRYVDTFEPEARIEISDALNELDQVEMSANKTIGLLRTKLAGFLGPQS